MTQPAQDDLWRDFPKTATVTHALATGSLKDFQGEPAVEFHSSGA